MNHSSERIDIQSIANIKLNKEFRNLLFGKKLKGNIVKVKYVEGSCVAWMLETDRGHKLQCIQLEACGRFMKMQYDIDGVWNENIPIDRAVQILDYISNKIQ